MLSEYYEGAMGIFRQIQTWDRMEKSQLWYIKDHLLIPSSILGFLDRLSERPLTIAYTFSLP